MKYAKIIINTKSKNLDKIFNYIIPKNLQKRAKIGMRVFVPFGNKNKLKEGYIIGFTENIDIDKGLLKNIHNIPEEPCVLTENLILLAKFMAEKYYCTLNECIRCIVPKIVKERTIKYVQINKNCSNSEILNIINKKNSQSRILIFLQKYNQSSTEELKNFLKISNSPINTLHKKGVINIFEKSNYKEIFDYNFKSEYKFDLTKEQKEATEFLKFKLNLNSSKKPTLLHGVTGSGKTEVYLQIIEETIKKGKQAIILVPEISLTSQTLERLVNRFGKIVTTTHSRLSDTERFEQWQKVKNGQISIMLGSRSAIFTPFENLGLIVIDEEHEHTYKSEFTPKYNTLDLAEKLSELTNCLVLYGSATPSIETYYNVTKGKYDLITLKNRINNSLPEINVIDMRKEIENKNFSIFSKSLFNAINENLNNNMQTILFLNRRGHSKFVSCRKCGYTLGCNNCNVSLTYHSYNNKLICHYCNSSTSNPDFCPSCNSTYIKYFGIGTQKVEEEIKKLFPKATTLRMDLDTTSKKNSHYLILETFKNGKADILIGTQMIAKGLDFPKVSLVGVLAADISLYSGDYKSSENCFQMITQVSGRSGRGKHKGKVFIQTYNPEHFSIKYAKNNDYLGFFQKELLDRKNASYPPFSNMFFIILSSQNEEELKTEIKRLFNILCFHNQKAKLELLGPSPTIIYKLNSKFRFKIIVKGQDEKRLKNFVLYCIEKFKKDKYNKNVNIILSLNPNLMQ